MGNGFPVCDKKIMFYDKERNKNDIHADIITGWEPKKRMSGWPRYEGKHEYCSLR